jgi:hypothetical protein
VPAAAPRAGEVVALQAYERIVRKALAANESDVQLLARLKAAGVVADQAAAAAGAYKSRLSEMLAHLDEETAKVGSTKFIQKISSHTCPKQAFSSYVCFAAS